MSPCIGLQYKNTSASWEAELMHLTEGGSEYTTLSGGGEIVKDTATLEVFGVRPGLFSTYYLLE